jgi:hypothetical protein
MLTPSSFVNWLWLISASSRISLTSGTSVAATPANVTCPVPSSRDRQGYQPAEHYLNPKFDT